MTKAKDIRKLRRVFVGGGPGTAGEKGDDGDPGESAYEVALSNGFVGTEEDWLASLIGATGPQGPQGPAGNDGATGPEGPQGPTGPTGATGAAGATGPQGPAGNDGADGADGVNGANGQGVPVGGTAGQVLEKIDGTDYNTQWTTPSGGGGGGTTIQTFSVTKNGNQQLTGNSYQDITGFDTPEYNEMSATWDGNTGEWTCPATGKYRLHYNLTLDQYNGNNRDSAWARLVNNGTEIKGSEQTGYHRQNTHGYNHYSFTRTVPLTLNDVIKVQCRNNSTARQHQILENSFVFEIEYLS